MIALFYTIPSEKIQALLEAANPQRRTVQKKFLFFKRDVEETFDGFWDFLKKHANEQEEYGYSGIGFCDLDLVLAERDRMLFDFGLLEPSQQLSAARNTDMAVFDQQTATAELAMLDSIALTEPEVKQYFRQDGRPDEEGVGTEAVLAAYAQAKKWLSSVHSSEVGILIVG